MSAEQAVFLKAYDALMAQAESGGPEGAQAARRAGVLATGRDPARAQQAWRRAAELDPLDALPRIALSRLAAQAGDLTGARAQAQSVYDNAVDEAERGFAAFALGEFAEASGDPRAARAAFSLARARAEAVLDADPQDGAAAHDLAAARQRLAELDLMAGDAAAARAGHEAAYALLAALADRGAVSAALLADLGFAQARLADLALEADDLPEARRRALSAAGFYDALARSRGGDPGLAEARAALATLDAEIARRHGAYDDAQRAMQEAIVLRVQRAAADPAQRGHLLAAWRRQAALFSESGDLSLADAARLQARALATTLYKENPNDEMAARGLIAVLQDDSASAMMRGDLEAARLALVEAVQMADARLAAARADRRRAGELAQIWLKLGDVAMAAARPPAAEDAYARATHLARMLHESAPDDLRALRNLAAATLKLGDASAAAGNHASADAALHESVNLRSQALARDETSAAAARDLAVALERLGLALRASGDSNAARIAWEDELGLAARAFPDFGEDALRFDAIVHAHLAALGGPDNSHHRRAALDALDQLAVLARLTPKDSRLRAQLWGAP